MNWFLSLLVGFLTAVGGCFGGLLVGSLCVKWYRISSFEGGSGYFVVMIGLLGIVVGLVTGIVASRVVAGGVDPTFLKGLGAAYACIGGLALVIGLMCWLAADIPPTRNGDALELAVEVRAPSGFTLPPPLDEYGAFSNVVLLNSSHQPQGKLRLEEATQVDGRWIVAATVPLETSVSRKLLRVYFNKEHDLMFSLFDSGKPGKKQFEWSAWLPSGRIVGKPQPSVEESFFMRYRVRAVPPPPPAPSYAEIALKAAAEERAAFESIPPEAPIATWLPHTKYGADPARLEIAVKHITARANFVEEYAALLRSPEHEGVSDALRLLAHVKTPPAALLAPVTESGRTIATMLRAFNATTPEQDPSYQGAADISVRFSAWMEAVRHLRERAGGDFTPELRAILELARERPDSQALRMDVVRVASFHLHEWTGQAPLPTDPKPRG